MYANFDAEILWLRLLATYLVNKCNLKRSKVGYCIFFGTYEKGKLELMMSVHVYDVFMDGKPQKLKNIKGKIKEMFKISKSEKVKNFLGVYYEWGHDAKCRHVRMTINKGVKNIVEVYKKFNGGDLKVKKPPRYPGRTLSKIELD